MRRITVLTAVLVAGLAAPAAGQVAFGPQVSWGDAFDFAIGGRAQVPLTQFVTAEAESPLSTLLLIGSFDLFFPDDGGIDGLDVTYFELNANAAYPLEVEGLSPYVGGGLNIGRYAVSFGGDTSSHTEAGLNVLGGLGFLLGGFNTYAEARYALGGFEQLILTFGVLFGGS